VRIWRAADKRCMGRVSGPASCGNTNPVFLRIKSACWFEAANAQLHRVDFLLFWCNPARGADPFVQSLDWTIQASGQQHTSPLPFSPTENSRCSTPNVE